MNKHLFVLFLTLVVTQLHGQILDDTTKLVYGPNTTNYFYEYDIKYNTGRRYLMDTSLSTLHRTDWRDRNNREYQSLGVIGTALYPTFFQFPEVVGLRSGFEAYDVYHRGKNSIRYYDTKSPFIDLNLVFGGAGQVAGNFRVFSKY